MNTEEYLICKAPPEHLTEGQVMERSIRHKKELRKPRCVNGHYVCSDCHTQGMDSIFGLCLAETSRDPAAIVRRMMALSFCHMHAPRINPGAMLLIKQLEDKVPDLKHGIQTGNLSFFCVPASEVLLNV